MQGLMKALWQSDSAFPSGGFAFSNGIEGAAAALGGLDRQRLRDLMVGVLRHRWACADRVALLHAYHAGDLARLGEIDRAFDAAAVVETLRTGSRRNGASLLTSHCRLGTEGAAALKEKLDAADMLGHLPIVQGWLWRRCGLDERSTVAVSAYTMVAAMATASVRLGVVGALDAQGALRECLAVAAELAEAGGAFDPAGPLRFPSATPWLDIASLRQSRAHVRLFSN